MLERLPILKRGHVRSLQVVRVTIAKATHPIGSAIQFSFSKLQPATGDEAENVYCLV